MGGPGGPHPPPGSHSPAAGTPLHELGMVPPHDTPAPAPSPSPTPAGPCPPRGESQLSTPSQKPDPTPHILRSNAVGRAPPQISRSTFATSSHAPGLTQQKSVRRWLSVRSLAVPSTWVRARGLSSATRCPGRRSLPAVRVPSPPSSLAIAAVCQLVIPAAGAVVPSARWGTGSVVRHLRARPAAGSTAWPARCSARGAGLHPLMGNQSACPGLAGRGRCPAGRNPKTPRRP